MSADDLYAEMCARGFITAAQAAEAGHPVTDEGKRRRAAHWANSYDPDVRAAFEAGRLQGLHEYDKDLVEALSWMLGSGEETTIRAAADWHNKQNGRADRRRRGDDRDPELLAEVARDRDRQLAADRRHGKELLAKAADIPPVTSAAEWREFCGPTVWARVCGEYAAAGWSMPGSAQTSRLRDAA